MNVIEPTNYEQAKDQKEWVNAMNEEYNSIMKNQSGELTQFPKNKILIGCKSLFKSMFKVDSNIDNYKERLVAKGYAKKEGVDFKETFTPISKLNTIRILVALTTKHK